MSLVKRHLIVAMRLQVRRESSPPSHQDCQRYALLLQRQCLLASERKIVLKTHMSGA